MRLPTRLDTDLRLIDVATRRVTLTGSEDFKPEEVVAYEAGYRVRPLSMLSLDIAAFSNRYDQLRSTEVDVGAAAAHRPRQPVERAH